MQETIGQRLKKAREHHGLTIDEAEEETHIRVNYLRALESDDYSIMPSAAQGRGFLRNYSEYLELNIDEVLADLQKKPDEISEINGPLINADVIPDQPAASVESTARPFWTRWLARRSNPESVPEVESPIPSKSELTTPIEPVESIKVETNHSKRRGRKKKEEKTSGSEHNGRKDLLEESSSIIEPPPAKDIEQVQLENKSVLIDDGQVERDALNVSERQNEAENPVVEAEQIQASNVPQAKEAKQSLLAKVSSLLKIRGNRNQVSVKEEISTQAKANGSASSEALVDIPASNETAEEIFISIGKDLQKRRELISLTHQEVERHIHVRAVYLKQMEEGAFDELPSPVQTRGMVANYATFLDLDTDAILLRFAEAIQARHRKKYPERLRSKNPIEVKPTIPPLRSFIAGDVIFGVSMVVILIGLAVWGVGRVMATQQIEKSTLPTAPSISDVLAGTPVPTVLQEVTFVPAEDLPVVASVESPTLEVPTLAENVNVQVNVTAVERAFIRVSVDGESVFDGRVVPGDKFTFEAEDQISILTGNAAALRVIYNGRDLGLMGNFGEVVSQIFTAAGLATPTATIQPTATATPLVTITPTPTLTPTSTLITVTPTLSTPTLRP